MTRETKIGLLVGLAFIIVIGILLSDHMTSTTQPQQALLSGAAPNVRESVTTPAPSQPAPPAVIAVRPITPVNPVPTQVELRPPPPPAAVVERVQVGGPSGAHPGGATGPIVIRRSGDEPGLARQMFGRNEPLTDVVPIGPIASAPEAPSPADPSDATSDRATADLEHWAGAGQLQAGSAVTPQPRTAAPTAPTRSPVVLEQPPVATTVTAGREYVAQPGDNLSRLASRMLGANTKANRDAIVRANPSLQKNPDMVVEGRKYKVPAAPARSASADPVPATIAPRPGLTGTAAIPETVPVPSRRASGPVPVTELVDALPAAPAADRGQWYVVRENDSLWKIASEQLGSGNAAAQIKALNQDVLQGTDNLQPNMRLRLPRRPMANAN